MSDLRIIVPEATINLITNPSVETNFTGYATIDGATAQRQEVEQSRGGYGIEVDPAAGPRSGLRYGPIALTNGDHTFSLDGLWATGVDYEIYIGFVDETPAGSPNQFAGIGRWARESVTANVAAGNYYVYVRKDHDPSSDLFYVDGLQLEALDHDTTYCDGDQDGCAWLGVAHGSISRRPVTTRRGGRVRDLEYFNVMPSLPYTGFNLPTIRHNEQTTPLSPGALLQSLHVDPRTLGFGVQINPSQSGSYAGSLSDMLRGASDLWDALKPDLTPDEAESNILRWVGPTSELEIDVKYLQGLEGFFDCDYTEAAALQFRCYDPYWRSIFGDGDIFDSVGESTAYGLSGRYEKLYDNNEHPVLIGPVGTYLTGCWNPIGTWVIIAGGFTTWDNDPALLKMIWYNPVSREWGREANFATAGCTDVTRVVCDSVTGDLYWYEYTGAVGRIYQWTFATGVRVQLGGNFVSTDVYGLYWNEADRVLYAAVDHGNVIVANEEVIYWNGAAWVALANWDLGEDAGGVSNTHASVIQRNPISGRITAGGTISLGATCKGTVREWDGAAWQLLGDTDAVAVPTRWVADIEFTSAGLLYVGGRWATIGGLASPSLAAYDGVNWLDIGADILDTDYISTMALDSSDYLYAKTHGATAELGGLDGSAPRIVTYTGTTWRVELPFSAVGLDQIDYFFTPADDLWLILGSFAADILLYVGEIILNNRGTAAAYPIITVSRNGGTSARLTNLINSTIDSQLLFDYDLADGERLRIDLRPGKCSIESNLFGAQNGALLSGSNPAQFYLLPGDNQVCSLVEIAGGAVCETIVEWQPRYWTVGGAEV